MTFPRLKPAARQAVTSVGLVFTVVAILVGNMPDSALKNDLGQVTQPFLHATGLQQVWGVFSQPRAIAAYVDGRVEFSDGSSSVYAIPDRRGVGAIVDYRWQKYMETLRPDDGREFWEPYAEYLTSRARADGHDPVRVTLIRRWAQTLPPGPGPEHGPWHDNVMAVFPVGESR